MTRTDHNGRVLNEPPWGGDADPTRPATPPEEVPPVPPELRDALLSRLRALPFDAFVRCAALLLARMGYREVRPAGRTSFRGRNQHASGGGGAGYDLSASLPAPAGSKRRATALVALKRYGPASPVYQRQVDELRGACLRVGAAEALLLTTGPLSPAIRHRDALPSAPLAPVRLIDGEEFAALLAAHGVGVARVAQGQDGGSGARPGAALDDAFFRRLMAGGAGAARRAPDRAAPVSAPHTTAAPRDDGAHGAPAAAVVRVTVEWSRRARP
jgi:hypothetical protein